MNGLSKLVSIEILFSGWATVSFALRLRQLKQGMRLVQKGMQSSSCSGQRLLCPLPPHQTLSSVRGHDGTSSPAVDR